MSNVEHRLARRRNSAIRLVARMVGTVHRGLYRRSSGRLGGSMRGTSVGLLTTRGRKTGRMYTWPVSYVAEGENILLIASAGGQSWSPSWYYNLLANPNVTMQIRNQTRAMVAEPQTGADRARHWERIVREYPSFEGYQRKTTREIPVVLLRPASDQAGE